MLSDVHERVEVREGRLTAEQMSALAASFANRDSLSSDPYSGVTDGPDIAIRYSDKLARGGSEVPKQVRDVHDRIRKLTNGTPVVKQ